MGAIAVNVGLENPEDRAAFKRGLCEEANVRKDERPVVGPITVLVAGRRMSADAIVLPPFSEVFVGRIMLAFLDLIADSRNRTLRPRLPDYPLLNMK